MLTSLNSYSGRLNLSRVGKFVVVATLITPNAWAECPSTLKPSDKFDVEMIRGGEAEFYSADGGLVVSVRSRTGIGRTTIVRKSASWPMVVKIRLYLKGLESFRISAGRRGVGVSVSGSQPHKVRVYPMPDAREGPELAKDNPLWVNVKLVAKNSRIPLRGGYFELKLPPALFQDNPREISLHWIDFYRE